ncbi:hypothetical protein GCM10011529_13360 [Polymorphobacter glacialis]|uniref:DUF885 domain-containing protein n=1 Tax=Sandarakinorhabdus glacialis TaxID=1614636 RepID=A0A916ZPR9_9SPHN|nr:DUF885 domain-containing protein [Polymorphobacter glacialis]GGE08245.1 hypothetical protein GCM10011529_13360 [Polymorphobacter glacialis]
MKLLAVALALCLAAPAAADNLKSIIADHWAWSLSIDPGLATEVGDRSGDGKLRDPSLAQADRNAVTAKTFITRLDAIDPAALTPADRVNRGVLRQMLADDVAGNAFGQRAMNFTTYSGWHTGFAGLPDRARFENRADYESYLGRLAAYPAFNAAQIAVTRTGLAAGYALPCAPLIGFEKSISAHITARPEASVFWTPFAGRQPGFYTSAEWTALQARAQSLIATAVVPAYRDFLAFYTTEYFPKCRTTTGIGATPGGREYYAYAARAMTTTAMTPDQIHRLGLSEVARIGAAMDAVAAGAGYPDRKAYVAHLRSDPKYYARTPQELLERSAWVTKQIDDYLPKIIGKLPRLPFSVKPIPADQAEGTTTAFSEWGSTANGRAGVYRVNTTHLDQRPFYEIPALTLHEAAPGHQTQGSLQQELDLPNFRKYQATFTAFVEGWALYAESLGEAMGLYDTPEKQMGRYSYEMWRANRLVVDTGMHVKGWSRDRAIEYMLANTALSRHNIEAEINRYITWPGQALAYKIGELTIQRLRKKAMASLGERFDERSFHDAILENGPVPLDVLEQHIDGWIASHKT